MLTTKKSINEATILPSELNNSSQFFASFTGALVNIQWLFQFSVVRHIYNVYLYVVAIPLFWLFRNGPRFGNYIGFWNGASDEELCSSLSNVNDPVFWEKNTAKCQDIIFQNFGAFLSMVSFFVYIFIVWCILKLFLSQVGRTISSAVEAIKGFKTRETTRKKRSPKRYIIRRNSGILFPRRRSSRNSSSESTELLQSQFIELKSSSSESNEEARSTFIETSSVETVQHVQ
jgi:hypothetical protein